MEEWIKVFIPLIGSLVGIAALWWKLTTSMATKKDISELRADMHRADDNLRVDMGKLSNRMDALYDAHHMGINKLNEKIDANSRAHQMETNKLNEKMEAGFTRLDEKIDAGLIRLDEKIDANSQAHHNDIMQVINKIDGVANDLRAEIRERVHGKVHDDEG